MNKKKTSAFSPIRLGTSCCDRGRAQRRLRRAFFTWPSPTGTRRGGFSSAWASPTRSASAGTSTASATTSSTTPSSSGQPLNRAFSIMQSLALGFSQVALRRRPRPPSSRQQDKPDADTGDSIDWGFHLSPQPRSRRCREAVWSYTFLSYLRDDPSPSSRNSRSRTRRKPSGASSRSSGSWPSTSACFRELEVHALLHSVLLPRPLPLLSSTATISITAPIPTSPSPGASAAITSSTTGFGSITATTPSIIPSQDALGPP